MHNLEENITSINSFKKNNHIISNFFPFLFYDFITNLKKKNMYKKTEIENRKKNCILLLLFLSGMQNILKLKKKC